jgi:hypothetical protein
MMVNVKTIILAGCISFVWFYIFGVQRNHVISYEVFTNKLTLCEFNNSVSFICVETKSSIGLGLEFKNIRF